MPAAPREPGRPGESRKGRRRLTFTRDDCLRQRRQFDRVYRSGRRSAAKGLVVIVAPGETPEHRLGMAVGKRVGNAVRRNRIRRRLREAFRLNRHRIPGCYDIVVNARAELAEQSFEELTENLLGAVRRAAGRADRRKTAPPPRKRQG